MRHGQRRRFFLVRWIVSGWRWLFPPTQAEADRQSTTARRLAIGGIVGLCVGMMALAIAYARPVKDAYDNWRADRLVQDANKALDGNDVVKAYLAVQEAVQIAPDHVPAIRLIAELLTQASKNQAVFFWERLQRMGVATVDDEVGYVRALLRLNRAKEASNYLSDLLEQRPADAHLVKVAEEVWGKGNAQHRILPKLKEYTARNPGDVESRLNIIRVQMASGDSDERTVARVGLFKLAAGTDAASLEALRMTYDLDDLSSDDRAEIVKLVKAHPLADERDRVAAFDQQVRLEPLRREQFIEAELRRTSELERDALFPISRWLVENKEFARLLAFLDVSKIKTHEMLLLNYMTALSALGRLNELERLVLDPETKIAASMRTFYRMHLTFVKGVAQGQVNMDLIKNMLVTCRNAALTEKRPDIIMSVGDYAEQRGLNDVAMETYKMAALNMGKVERRALAGWLRTALNCGDTAAYKRAAAEGARRWPDDQTFQEHNIYADLLQGEHVETQLKNATRLLELRPDDSLRKLIVALGFWRLGDAATALSNMQNIKLDDVGGVGRQAIFAALARANGFPDVAATVEEKFPTRTTMLPEEREALARSKQ